MRRTRGYARSNVKRPSRTWVGVGTGFGFAAVTVTTASVVMSLEAPTSLALTSDPPEDLTILRILGDFSVVLSAASSTWVLALVVQGTVWTPSGTFNPDADKRILWMQTYSSGANAVSFIPPGVSNEAGVLTAGLPREATRIDIAPKVKLEAGQALYAVAYEEVGAAALTMSNVNMRMLFQRSGRR